MGTRKLILIVIILAILAVVVSCNPRATKHTAKSQKAMQKTAKLHQKCPAYHPYN